jgi:integrase
MVKSSLSWWFKILTIKTVDEIRLSDVLAAVRGYGWSQITKNHKIAYLRAFVTWCRLAEFSIANPLSSYRQPHQSPARPYHTFTLAETIRILQETPDQGERMAYSAAVFTGFRLGELRSRRVKDLDLESGRFALDAGHAKNRKERAAFLPSPFLEELRPLCSRATSETPLFPSLQYHSVSSRLRGTCATLGITPLEGRRITFYSFRRAHATLLMGLGIGPETVRDSMGHSTFDMTSHYVERDENRMKDIARAFQAIAGQTLVRNTYDENCDRGRILHFKVKTAKTNSPGRSSIGFEYRLKKEKEA